MGLLFMVRLTARAAILSHHACAGEDILARPYLWNYYHAISGIESTLMICRSGLAATAAWYSWDQREDTFGGEVFEAPGSGGQLSLPKY